jgi:transposase InsO family protein
VLELLLGAKNRVELCREHQMASSVLADWKAIFLRRVASVFDSPEVPQNQGPMRVMELERLVGRLTLEHDLLDVYSRAMRGWHLSRHLDQSLTLTALRRALVHHRPEIHHSDQGVQYAATAYIQLLQASGVQISMASVGEATENGYAERLRHTIKENVFMATAHVIRTSLSIDSRIIGSTDRL